MRNNWITLPSQMIQFCPPGENTTVSARWSDVVEVYEKEKKSALRRTRLTAVALNPSAFEKQKVSLVLKVFDDKTIAALIQDGYHDTACFISYIVKLWKQLNNRSVSAHIHLNDPIRAPITNTSQLKFIQEMSECFKKTTPNRGRLRANTLTKQTTMAITQTLDGIVAMSTYLLTDCHVKYVLLGQFQSDSLEGEFGCYRQMFGGLYHIAFEQVLIAAKCRRLKFLHDLNLINEEYTLESGCIACNDMVLSDDELSLIDNAPNGAHTLSTRERSLLFYISGFIAKKECLQSEPNLQDYIDPGDSDFLEILNRGLLTLPPKNLFYFSQASYVFFKRSPPHLCHKKLTYSLLMLQNHFFNFENPQSICRRMANIFLSGFVRRENDLMHEKQDRRKKIKLSGQIES